MQVEGSIPTAVAEPGPQSASPVANNFRKISFAAAGVVMILLLSFYLYSHFSTSNALVDAPLEPLDKSIVVLPFTNLSSDPQQEYFSDGMMEEILNHLVKIEELKVISRTTAMQYKQTAKSVREITRELQVATALEGSVRKEGNLVRITVQLIEGETDTHLWSESYDRELTNVFQVQSDVAKQIAAVLRAEISPAAKRSIESRPTSNPEAYNLYLMAEQVGLTNTALAIDLYEQVIQKDPEFASAYAKLGNLKRSLERHNYHPNAAAAVKIAAPYFQKALELDPDNYFAHLGKGQSHLWYEWDFAAANKVYQFLKDKYPNAFILPALLLSTGRFSEALENSRRNIEKDPLDPISHAYYILSLYYAGNYEELLEKIPKSLMLLEGVRTQRNGTFLRLRIAEVYQFLGMYQQSLRMYDEDIDQLDAPEWLAIRAINYHHLGNSDKTGELLEKLKLPAISTLPGGPAFRMASVYAQLQANDEAFDWLDIAYQNHEAEMYWLKVYPSFVPLYGDPRWQHMLDRVGFPESLK